MPNSVGTGNSKKAVVVQTTIDFVIQAMAWMIKICIDAEDGRLLHKIFYARDLDSNDPFQIGTHKLEKGADVHGLIPAALLPSALAKYLIREDASADNCFALTSDENGKNCQLEYLLAPPAPPNSGNTQPQKHQKVLKPLNGNEEQHRLAGVVLDFCDNPATDTLDLAAKHSLVEALMFNSSDKYGISLKCKKSNIVDAFLTGEFPWSDKGGNDQAAEQQTETTSDPDDSSTFYGSNSSSRDTNEQQHEQAIDGGDEDASQPDENYYDTTNASSSTHENSLGPARGKTYFTNYNPGIGGKGYAKCTVFIDQTTPEKRKRPDDQTDSSIHPESGKKMIKRCYSSDDSSFASAVHVPAALRLQYSSDEDSCADNPRMPLDQTGHDSRGLSQVSTADQRTDTCYNIEGATFGANSSIPNNPPSDDLKQNKSTLNPGTASDGQKLSGVAVNKRTDPNSTGTAAGDQTEFSDDNSSVFIPTDAATYNDKLPDDNNSLLHTGNTTVELPEIPIGSTFDVSDASLTFLLNEPLGDIDMDFAPNTFSELMKPDYLAHLQMYSEDKLDSGKF